jgi:hypothetical protein
MSRRKIREESETKLRKVAQQLLLNRIKQQAIQAKSAIGVEYVLFPIITALILTIQGPRENSKSRSKSSLHRVK